NSQSVMLAFPRTYSPLPALPTTTHCATSTSPSEYSPGPSFRRNAVSRTLAAPNRWIAPLQKEDVRLSATRPPTSTPDASLSIHIALPNIAMPALNVLSSTSARPANSAAPAPRSAAQSWKSHPSTVGEPPLTRIPPPVPPLAASPHRRNTHRPIRDADSPSHIAPPLKLSQSSNTQSRTVGDAPLIHIAPP